MPPQASPRPASSASCVARGPVECLTLTRAQCNQLLGASQWDALNRMHTQRESHADFDFLGVDEDDDDDGGSGGGGSSDGSGDESVHEYTHAGDADGGPGLGLALPTMPAWDDEAPATTATLTATSTHQPNRLRREPWYWAPP